MVSIIPIEEGRRRRRSRQLEGEETDRHFFAARGDRPRLLQDGEQKRVPVEEQARLIAASRSTLIKSFYSTAIHYDMSFELAAQRERFAGEESFTMYRFPRYLRTVIDRLRRNVQDGVTAPQLNNTVACLISYGLDNFTRSRTFQCCRDLAGEFQDSQGDGRIIDQLARHFYEMNLEIVDMSGTGVVDQFNVYMSDMIRKSVIKAGTTIGLPGSKLAPICIMIALYDQIPVLEVHRAYIETTLTMFLQTMRARRKVGEQLISIISQIAGDADDDSIDEADMF